KTQSPSASDTQLATSALPLAARNSRATPWSASTAPSAARSPPAFTTTWLLLAGSTGTAADAAVGASRVRPLATITAESTAARVRRARGKTAGEADMGDANRTLPRRSAQLITCADGVSIGGVAEFG